MKTVNTEHAVKILDEVVGEFGLWRSTHDKAGWPAGDYALLFSDEEAMITHWHGECLPHPKPGMPNNDKEFFAFALIMGQIESNWKIESPQEGHYFIEACEDAGMSEEDDAAYWLINRIAKLNI